MLIMLRHLPDDFYALRMANAMTECGARVVCITDSGGPPFKPMPGRFIVWAEISNDSLADQIDKAYERLGEETMIARIEIGDKEGVIDDK